MASTSRQKGVGELRWAYSDRFVSAGSHITYRLQRSPTNAERLLPLLARRRNLHGCRQGPLFEVESTRFTRRETSTCDPTRTFCEPCVQPAVRHQAMCLTSTVKCESDRNRATLAL
jgi:hypothetical protein